MNSDKNKIKLKAYAKINLALYITGQRRDGYHLLDSIFVPIGIYDEISIKTGGCGINVKCDNSIPVDESNTARKAAKLVMEMADIAGVEIEIKKNIPVMAGLGGGSADAAAVLIGMNELYGLDINRQMLAEMGLKIGADVPFFLGEGAARVRGIGEIITPVKIDTLAHLVMIKPEASLSTAEVYKKYDEISKEKAGSCEKLISALEEDDLPGVSALLHNDLQVAAQLMCPDISASIDFLRSNHALSALMTGSGSCVFGLFGSERDARTAAGRYSGNGKTYMVQTVASPVIEFP